MAKKTIARKEMIAANIKDIPGVLDVLSIASPRVGSPPVHFKVHESCLQR